MTLNPWPWRVRISLPLSASQIFTVLSKPPLTIRVPWGLIATLVTSIGVSFQSVCFDALAGVPHFDQTILATADDVFAIAADRHTADWG